MSCCVQCNLNHDDGMTWKRLPYYWPLCEGNPPVTGGFPSQRVSNAHAKCFLCSRLNELLKTQSSCRLFETPCRSCLTVLRIICARTGPYHTPLIVSVHIRTAPADDGNFPLIFSVHIRTAPVDDGKAPHMYHPLSLAETVLTTDESTVKSVCNYHLYDKIYYLWSIQ